MSRATPRRSRISGPSRSCARPKRNKTEFTAENAENAEALRARTVSAFSAFSAVNSEFLPAKQDVHRAGAAIVRARGRECQHLPPDTPLRKPASELLLQDR